MSIYHVTLIEELPGLSLQEKGEFSINPAVETDKEIDAWLWTELSNYESKGIELELKSILYFSSREGYRIDSIE